MNVNVKNLLQLFIEYLQIERNNSQYTIESYQNDLEHFCIYGARRHILFFRCYICGCSFIFNRIAR